MSSNTVTKAPWELPLASLTVLHDEPSVDASSSGRSTPVSVFKRRAYSTRQPCWPVRLAGAAVRTKLSVPFWYSAPGESLRENAPLAATICVRPHELFTPPVSHVPPSSVSNPLLNSVEYAGTVLSTFTPGAARSTEVRP